MRLRPEHVAGIRARVTTTLYLSETLAGLGLLPAAPFAVTLGAEQADPRR